MTQNELDIYLRRTKVEDIRFLWTKQDDWWACIYTVVVFAFILCIY